MENIGCGEKIINFSCLGREEQELAVASVRAREYAYCPYSKFAVGAAVKTQDGNIYTGCNVENAAYPDTICAERTAIVKAVSEGNQDFSAIAISGVIEPCQEYVFPCGSCRQVISEFVNERDIIIYMVKPDLKQVYVSSLSQLLPHTFKK